MLLVTSTLPSRNLSLFTSAWDTGATRGRGVKLRGLTVLSPLPFSTISMSPEKKGELFRPFMEKKDRGTRRGQGKSKAAIYFYKPRTMSLTGSSGPMSGLAVVNTRELTFLGDDELGDDVGLVWGPKTKSSLAPSRPSRTISALVSS